MTTSDASGRSGASARPTNLPLLADRKSTLEKCVYCPKLCRASCPVSNAEPNESLTPWGKMSAASFMSRGALAIEPPTAAVAWACTGCHGCRERCDHKNEVADTLSDARADLFTQGAAPAAAVRIANGEDERGRALSARARELNASLEQLETKPIGALLVGCGYHRADATTSTGERLDRVARDAASALVGAPLRVVEGCCGLPLLQAGDREGFRRAAEKLASAVSTAKPLVVADPGCAHALLEAYPRVGVAAVEPTLLVDLAAKQLERLRSDARASTPRYHDPCQLGRGLQRFDEPRRVLAKVAGAAPSEFQRNRELADCSGGGGLLPVTMPETSDRIAKDRLVDHRERGGGPLVTACASSLRRFRASGEPATDLIEWIARGLGCDSKSG